MNQVTNSQQLCAAVLYLITSTDEAQSERTRRAIYDYLGYGQYNVTLSPEREVLVLSLAANKVEIIGD